MNLPSRLIVALVCSDGIVLASEGQATTWVTGTPVREKMSKIKQPGTATIWAASGDVSIIQKIEKAVEALPVEVKNSKIGDFVPRICNCVFLCRETSLDRYRRLYGTQRGEEKATSASLIVAGYDGKTPRIVDIDQDGEDHECQEVGYATIGIGAVFAHAILHGRDIHSLTLDQAITLAYKVIKDAIEVGAYGLGEPIDIWTIQCDPNQGYKIEQLDAKAIAALQDTYLAIKKSEEELFKSGKGST